MTDETLLLCSVGAGEYEQRYEYRLDEDRSATTNLVPLAMAELFDVDMAVVAYTKSVKQSTMQSLDDGFEKRGIECIRCPIVDVDVDEIASSETDDFVVETFASVIAAIQNHDPDGVIVDLTLGIRAHQFVLFSSVFQLAALADIAVNGIYYGMRPLSEDDAGAIVDLTTLATFVEWHHALRSFETTASLRPAATLLTDNEHRFLGDEPDTPGDDLDDAFDGFVNQLGKAARALDSGLSLQSGLAVDRVTDAASSEVEDRLVGPSSVLLDPLTTRLEKISMGGRATEVSNVQLDEAELNRQRHLVEFYRETDRYQLALQCARELFINRLLYTKGGEYRRQWLSKDKRVKILRQLPEPDPAAIEREKLNDPARELWMKLGRERDVYSKAGFVETEIDVHDVSRRDTVDCTLMQLCKVVDSDEFWSEIV